MKRNVLLVGALMTLSTAAMAGPSAGDIEIVFSAANSRLLTIDGETYFSLYANVGYFLDANHEIGGAFGLSYNTISDETVDIGGFYRYNLVHQPDATDWWYAGAELSFRDVTEEFAEPMLLRPHVGQKYMLSDDVAFDWNAGYEIDLSDAERDDILDVRLGLSIFF